MLTDQPTGSSHCWFLFPFNVCSLCTAWAHTTTTIPTIITQHNRNAVLFVVLNSIAPKKSCCFFAVGWFIICFTCRISYFSHTHTHTVRLLIIRLHMRKPLFHTYTLWLIHFCGFIAIFMAFYSTLPKSYISIMVFNSFDNPKIFQ